MKKNDIKDRDRVRLKALKPEFLLIAIFILAILIRLLYLNQIASTPVYYGLAMDSDKYDTLATYILQGNFTHKDFIYLNPLYPFFLALIYLIFGQSHFPVALIQATFDSFSCMLVYYIAAAFFNKRVGIIAAFIYACYGIAIFYTGILLAPTVVIFLTLLFVASLIAAEQKRAIFIFFISGILLGFSVLARPNVILFLFLLPLWFFAVLRQKIGTRKSVRGMIYLLTGFFIITSLITVRNYFIEKKLSPFSAQGGINFYIGNNPEATGFFMSPQGISSTPVEQVLTSIEYAEQEAGGTLTTSEASRYWLFKGISFIKEYPLDAFLLYIKKCTFFWRKEEIPINIHFQLCKNLFPIFRLPLISFGMIAPFAILGIILSLKRWKSTLLITLFAFSYMLSVIVFFVSARYRLPTVPFLIIFSSYALYRSFEVVRAKGIKEIAVWGIVLILLFIGIHKDFKCYALNFSHVHYNNLGSIYRKNGELDKAISTYKEALSINPNFAEAYSNLGITYVDKGMFSEAIIQYGKALTINPDLLEAHNNLGIAHYKKGEFDKAIFEYKKALSIRSHYAEVHSNLGSAYLKKGELDKAILEYKKALSINPDYAEARSNLGIAHSHKKEKLDKEIAAYKKFLADNPNLAEAHYNLGVVYGNKGMLDEAISEYKKALTIEPNLVNAHINLGSAYRKKGMLDEAIAEGKRALNLDPKEADAYNNLGNAYLKKGELDKSISAYKKALAIKPGLAGAHSNLGIAYYYKEDYKSAILHLDKAVKLEARVDPKLLELLKPHREGFLKNSK